MVVINDRLEARVYGGDDLSAARDGGRVCIGHAGLGYWRAVCGGYEGIGRRRSTVCVAVEGYYDEI